MSGSPIYQELPTGSQIRFDCCLAGHLRFGRTVDSKLGRVQSLMNVQFPRCPDARSPATFHQTG